MSRILFVFTDHEMDYDERGCCENSISSESCTSNENSKNGGNSASCYLLGIVLFCIQRLLMS